MDTFDTDATTTCPKGARGELVEVATRFFRCPFVSAQSLVSQRITLSDLSTRSRDSRNCAATLPEVVLSLSHDGRPGAFRCARQPKFFAALLLDSLLGLTSFQLTCYNGFS